MIFFNGLTIFFPLFLFLSSLIYGQQQGTNDPLSLVSHPSDTRANAYLQLPNGMEVILLSDPQVKKASLSLVVPTGSYSEPLSYPGLARLHQKMLISRSENFSENDGIENFLMAHEGEDLSGVDGVTTHFTFAIEHPALEGLVARVVDAVNRPLLEDIEQAQKKARVLHSESYQSCKTEQVQMTSLLEGLSSHKEISHFKLGNLKTLRVNDKLLAALNQYHEDAYSSSIMKCVIISNKPVDTLVELTKSHLAKASARPSKGKAALVLPAEEKLESGRFVIKSDSDMLSFFIPVKGKKTEESHQLKTILSQMITSPQINTFTGHMIHRGLLKNIRLSTHSWPSAHEFIHIHLELSPLGAANKEAIIAAFYQYLMLFGELTTLAAYHQELTDILQLERLVYKPVSDPAFARKIAQNLGRVSPEETLVSDLSISPYDHDLAQRFQAAIDPDSVIVFDFSKNPSGSLSKDKHLSIPYRFEAGPISSCQQDETLFGHLKLPEVNRYIPDNFDIQSIGDYKRPALLEERGRVGIWYMENVTPFYPVGSITIHINMADALSDMDAFVTLNMLIDIFNERLSVIRDHAIGGVNEVEVLSDAGLRITVCGIPQKQPMIIKDILALLIEPVKEEEISSAIAHYKDKLRRLDGLDAVKRVFLELENIKAGSLYSSVSMRNIAEQMSCDSMNRFQDRLLSSQPVRLFSFGSYTREQLDEFLLVVTDKIRQPEDSQIAALKTQNTLDVSAGEVYQLNSTAKADVNMLIDTYIHTEGGNKSKAALIVFLMMTKTAESGRTNLGIKDSTVDVFYREFGLMPALTFFVSGGKEFSLLMRDVDKYRKEIAATFDHMTKHNFNLLKQEIIAQVEDAISNLEYDSNYHMANWIHSLPEAYSRIEVIKSIREVELSDIQSLVQGLRDQTGVARIVVQQASQARGDSFMNIAGQKQIKLAYQ